MPTLLPVLASQLRSEANQTDAFDAHHRLTGHVNVRPVAQLPRRPTTWPKRVAMGGSVFHRGEVTDSPSGSKYRGAIDLFFKDSNHVKQTPHLHRSRRQLIRMVVTHVAQPMPSDYSGLSHGRISKRPPN